MTDPALDRRPAAPRVLILFGAFDRHNFGDLLLARCVAALHPAREPVFAGLAARDLSRYGGHHVQTLATVVAAHGDDAADFMHVGGEVLTTTAWEAAVMLQTTDDDAARAIRAHDRNPAARRAWAASLLGTGRHMPYVVCGDDLPSGWTVHFNAVGGVALDSLEVEERTEVLQALRSAATVGVRDARTHAALASAGIRAALVRDPAAATARLLGGAIAQRARDGEIAELAARMPHWIAVQLAADWGDDATLERIAAALSRRRAHRDAGIVLFRAGLAPWHDERETLERLAARVVGQPVAVFESAHVLDLCALLAGARAYLGTSLHGWIVADSFEVPAHCLVRGAADKAAAYIDTWTGAGRRWRTLADADLLPSPRDRR